MKSKPPPPPTLCPASTPGAEPDHAHELSDALGEALAVIDELREEREAREAQLEAVTRRSLEQERELSKLRDRVAVNAVYRKLAVARGSVIERLMREGERRLGSGPRKAARAVQSVAKKSAS